MHYSLPCVTELVQSADPIVITKFLDEWFRRWNTKNSELMQGNEWSHNVRDDGGLSGKLKNPGKL